MQQNRLLSILAQRHPANRLGLKRVDFMHGDRFGSPGEPIEHAVFPVSGMVSIVVDLGDGDMVEAAMVGRDGIVSGAAAFGASHHLNSSFGQLPGTAYLLSARDLVDIAGRDEVVRDLLIGYEQFILAQAQQTAACNAKHHILQRLASWLMRAQAATGQSEMFLTQEFLAEMLGVQRASVSGFAGQLQDMDLIRYRRGRLSILDTEGLARRACECHGRLQQHRNLLLGSDEAPKRAAG